MKRMRLLLTTGVGVFSLAAAGLFSAMASADSANINFEGSAYSVGSINGQDGWTKTGPYDVAVASTSSFPNASGFGFGAQALRLSNAVTSGSFGDQTFSPALSQPVGETQANKEFNLSFSIGSTQASQQPGLFLSVSPDSGSGSRMSYVGFDDQSDGVHVIFYDVTDNGPLGTVATFNPSDVATISRTAAHTIKMTVDTVPGAGNDVVKLYVDGALKHTGTSWEDYYRYDPEQAGNGNTVPAISKVLFREGGTAASATSGNGYLVDNLSYASSQPAPATPTYPTSEAQCKNNGWKQFTGPTFKNQGQCVAWVNAHANGDLRLSDPHQRIVFSATNNMDKHHGHNTVSYWNYDYPGGLHYTAAVTCSYVNPQANEARFMFQIPSGHPGLSGQYVVAYVKDVNGRHQPDLYGHAATGDLATATQWCQTGTGFSPTMYTVTKGNVDVDQGASGRHFRWWF